MNYMICADRDEYEMTAVMMVVWDGMFAAHSSRFRNLSELLLLWRHPITFQAFILMSIGDIAAWNWENYNVLNDMIP